MRDVQPRYGRYLPNISWRHSKIVLFSIIIMMMPQAHCLLSPEQLCASWRHRDPATGTVEHCTKLWVWASADSAIYDFSTIGVFIYHL